MTSVPANLPDIVRTLRSFLISQNREIGDVRRNAALFLAIRAGTSASSFGKGLSVTIEDARLAELSYLAALGFLIGAGVLQRPYSTRLRDAVAKLSRRSLHTPERTGYADEPMCASGLLLLAQAIDHQELVSRLTLELSNTTPSDPALQALVAVILAREVDTARRADANLAETVAAALLLRRCNEELGRRMFPGLPQNLDARLAALVVTGNFGQAADFGAMLVLAALEVSLGLRSDDAPPVVGPCDVGIVVALKEEFRILFERFQSRCTHINDGGRTYYIFEAPTLGAGAPYRCVATLIGDMGTNRAGVAAEKMLGTWQPAVVAMVGIAGGIHEDVRLGDVIVASQVDNYIEGAKVVDGAAGPEFRRTSDSFKCDHDLLNRIRNFEFSHQITYAKWQHEAASRVSGLQREGQALAEEGMLREQPETQEGHIASGPVVITSKDFVGWIKNGDRACLAVEMEAAGLMIATHMDPSGTAALVIRGISDFGDDRKAKHDRLGGGAVRALAMSNATSYLWGLMEAGLLPRRAEQ